jgi:hypothetical protein
MIFLISTSQVAGIIDMNPCSWFSTNFNLIQTKILIICMLFTVQFSYTECLNNGELVFHGYRNQIWEDKKVWKWMVVMVVQQCEYSVWFRVAHLKL